jgi:AcrR family transcriptional regulator
MGQAGTSRERLLEAAIAAIEDGGEASLRVDRITEEVGVAKPTLYHFFGSREGLVSAALAERFRRLIVVGLESVLEVVRNAESLEDFAEILPLSVRLSGDAEGAERRAARVAVLGSAVARPELAREIRQSLLLARDQFAEFFRVGKERGFIPADRDPDVLAMWWYAEITGRHMIDLVDDPYLNEQWEELTIRNLRFVVLGK